MKLKKILLLAAMALAAMVVAGPASASAAMMLHEGAPIAEAGEMETFSGGPVGFENESGGVSCNAVTATITVTTEDLHVTAYNQTECETTGLLAAFGCEIEGNPVSEELPWTVTIDPTVGPFTIHLGLIRYHMNSGCFFGEEVNITGGTVAATPNNPASISSITLSGEVETSIGAEELSGTFNASNPGTYEIE